jgi:HlyD family secretion protein
VVTYDVVISVGNPDLLLKPGMTATTRIFTAERNDVLRVPDQALHYAPVGATQSQTGARPAGGARRPANTGQARVFVLRDGEPVAVPISIGLDDDANAEVLSGELKQGDEVIVSETRSGQAVRGGTGGNRGSQPRFRF